MRSISRNFGLPHTREIKLGISRSARARERSHCSPAILRASWSSCFANAALELILEESPCRNALRLARVLPAFERGPCASTRVTPVGGDLSFARHG
jgi:hypothetical protein